MGVKVGFQGKHGTFSEIAALRYFAEADVEPCGYPNFKAILTDVENGVIDYGVMPVENTITGIISACYDLLFEYNVWACGEIDIPIRENLIVLPGTKMEEIKEVFSHPEALSQCAGFFADHPAIASRPWRDTAASVEYVRECNDRSKAALGSWRAAEYYGMESLLVNVQSSMLNMTRFLIVGREKSVPLCADKISVMAVLRHEPGSLYRLLSILADRGINLLKLESRPIQGKVFEYKFYIDFEGNPDDPIIQDVMNGMRERCEEMIVLGCYKAAEIDRSELKQ